ncbi:MAG: PAS domain S-box protein [Planctomycetes bacterium]|nr:PAS domain S-box protein [Planctomycetota bacterium]
MTMADGLSSTDVRGLVGLNEGVLYVGTTGGLTRIATDRWKCATQPPRIDLELWRMGESLVRGANTRLAMPLNDQGLVADMLTMGQRNRVGMSFQYRIPEAFDDWSDWSAQQRIILPELGAGRYTMHVRGRNAAGLISNEAVKEFEILAPLWQTPAFIASSGGGAFLALFAGAYVARRRIHYRRRIEQSERKYRTLVESIRVIPYQAESHSGEFRYVGPQASKLIGHEMSAWMGPGVWSRVIAQDDEPAVRSLWKHAASNGGHFIAEHRLNGENGEIRWVRNIASAANEASDKLISGLMIDITAEKRAEAGDKARRAELESAVAARTAELSAANESLRKEIEERRRVESALRDSEERFSKLFNRSPVAMVLSTLQGGIVLNANDAHLHMTGFSREELIGRPIAEFNTWADMADRVRFVEQLRRDGSVSGFNASFYTKDRRLRVGRVAAECIEHNGQMCLLSAALDITETHQIEMELEKQRQFLNQLINLNPHLIFAKDADGRFTLVNETIAEVYGTTIENLIGKTDADFNQNTEEVAFFRSIDREVMRSGQEHRVEEVITDSNGKIRHLETIKIPLSDEKGIAFGILGVATDITLRKRAEDSLRNAHDQLELRVQERTASLREAEQRARESEELLHHMTDAIPRRCTSFEDQGRRSVVRFYQSRNRRNIRGDR